MSRTIATLEQNAHGRTFVHINDRPTFIHFDTPVSSIRLVSGNSKAGVVEVDGTEYAYRLDGASGVMDNRHHNWKFRG